MGGGAKILSLKWLLAFPDEQSGSRIFPRSAEPVAGLILSTLFCYLVQNNPGTRAQIETFDHSKHGNGDALSASLGGEVANSFCFISEPNCQLGMFGKIAFVQQNIGHALSMG
ncbi:hypothetical protein AD945_07805 [Gluconobacter albidus]|uniref:Uncharacterized protein n=1 Tax=Gluconobacter albidus TaxID=318683 RepID=A0A149TJT7_9PROT|nr:hypothetical protein AD945_07805 [Gluconobacter albidus]